MLVSIIWSDLVNLLSAVFFHTHTQESTYNSSQMHDLYIPKKSIASLVSVDFNHILSLNVSNWRERTTLVEDFVCDLSP